MAPAEKGIIPVHAINEDFARVNAGSMPRYSMPDMLRMLQLDGRDADGLGLAERLLLNTKLTPTVGRALLACEMQAAELRDVTNEYRASDAQEAMAATLGAVATQQIRREREICPRAAELVMRSTRSDIIPADVHRIIHEGEADFEGGILAMLRELLLQPDGLVIPSGTIIVVEHHHDHDGHPVIEHDPNEPNVPPPRRRPSPPLGWRPPRRDEDR